MVASIPPKKVVNADTGTADLVGGDDWDILQDWMNDVDTTGPVKFNTETRIRSGKLKFRDTGNDHNYTNVFSNLAADRNVTWPLLTGNDQVTFDAHASALSNKTIDVQTNIVKLRNYTYLIYKNGSTYYAQKDDGTITSNSDFKTLFQAIIDSIPTRDDTVFTSIKIAPGDYDVNTTIAIADKYNLSIEGSGIGVTRIRAGASLGATTDLLICNGSVSGTGKVLTSNTTAKSKNAVMSSGDASTFAIGDWILLRSNIDFGTGGSASGHQGEIKQIASISSGTITFREPIFDIYTTTNGSNIIKLLPMRNLSFSNFTLGRHASYAGTNCFWWYVRFADRVSVRNCEVVDYPGQYAGAMDFRSCTNVRVSDCHMQQNIAYNFQYGISFTECCQDCVCSNCTSHGDWRHPFEAGSGGTSTNDEGVCRNIKFVNCTATGGSQNAFDSHPEGEGIYFVNCGVLGTHDGGGFKLRSPNSGLIGCWVKNSSAPVSLQPAIQISDGGSYCVISNCYVIDCDTEGIRVRDGLSGTIIEGCIIDNCSGDGIKVDASGVIRTAIRNNTIMNNTGDGIDLSATAGSMITGNIIRDNSGYGVNFTAATCTDNIITSNIFGGNGSGSKNNGGQSGCVEANNIGY